MSLGIYEGKKVRIVDNENCVYIGVIGDFIYPEDNEDGQESIILDSLDPQYSEEFNAARIKSIEII